MSDRVSSTMTAKESIVKLQQVMNGPLIEQLRFVTQQGQTLSDSNVWDGQLAIEFRGKWPKTHQTLVQAMKDLEELRQTVERINHSIMAASGNS